MADSAGEEGVRFSEIPLLLFIRGLLAVTVMVSLIAGLHFYLGHRLIDGLALPTLYTHLGWMALWALFASMPIAFASRMLPKPIAKVLQWLGYLWMGSFGV